MIRKQLFVKALPIILMLLFFNVGSKFPVMSENTNISRTVEIVKPNNSNYPLVVRQRLHEELVSEVKSYITKMAPKSKVSADVLVTVCQKYDMDITFVLAQGLIESHFGTMGMAVKTNSVFNVGTWDSKKVLRKYKTPNESIEDFVILVKKDYLSKRTMTQLLRDGGYKNKNGHRYASAPNYEQSLRSTIANITMETSIKTYQEVINMSDEKMMTYFGPENNSNLIKTDKLTASIK
jgi:flagellum-specific peptidoglycan hydrolase FlgJ